MYLLSVLGIILCIVGVSYISPAVSPVEYVDVISILFLLVMAVPILISSGLLKDLSHAFKLVLGKEKQATMSELKRAKLAVQIAMKILLYGGIMLMLLQIIVVLHLPKLVYVGPSISTAILTLLYAVICDILLLPVRARLEVRILEYMQPEDETASEMRD